MASFAVTPETCERISSSTRELGSGSMTLQLTCEHDETDQHGNAVQRRNRDRTPIGDDEEPACTRPPESQSIGPSASCRLVEEWSVDVDSRTIDAAAKFRQLPTDLL